MSTFSLIQVGDPSELDTLLNLTSANVSTRNLDCQPVRITTTKNGITTSRQTVSFNVKSRQTFNSTQVPSHELRDQISGFRSAPIPIVQNADGSIGVNIPEWKVAHPLVANNEPVEVYGNALQVSGGREMRYYFNTAPMRLEGIIRQSQYEFFMTNPFPSSFTVQQIAQAIEDGLPGSCLWVIKKVTDPTYQVSTIHFAVTPARVIRDVRKFDRTITTPELLQNLLKSIREYLPQAPDRIANIFPRVEVLNGKLVNTSIINGKSWVGQKNILSTTGQILQWSWVLGLFNDTENNGTLSTQMGPSIYDIKRSDWQFIPFDNLTEFTLVDSPTEKARIDQATKTIYYSSARRTVFSLQLRQERTDKGEDYAGYYAPAFNFYSTSLGWFLANTFQKP